MSISNYRNRIIRNLDILESATRNAQILKYIEEMRLDVKELYEHASNYQDALSYINGITQNVHEEMAKELEPDDFQEAFSEVPMYDDFESIFYNAEAMDEAIRNGVVIKNSDGSLSSADEERSGKLSELMNSENYYISDEELELLMQNLDLSFLDEEKEEGAFVKSDRNVMEFLDEDGNEVNFSESIFEEPEKSDSFASYDEIRELLKTSPDRLAFLRSTRIPKIDVESEPINVTEEELFKEDSSDEKVPSIDDFVESSDKEVLQGGNIESSSDEEYEEEEDLMVSDDDIAEYGDLFIY